MGGRTSHSAILARALEIPAVVAVNGFLNQVKNGDEIVLDGSEGDVYVNPQTEVRAEYQSRQEAFLREKKELEQYIGKPTVTRDGISVELVANIGKPEDIDKVLQYDGEGVGLFRTEFLFMDRNSMPTEDEQFEAYKKAAVAMNGKPVIIRTLEIGGEFRIWDWKRMKIHFWDTGQSVSAWIEKRTFIDLSFVLCCAPALLETLRLWFR